MVRKIMLLSSNAIGYCNNIWIVPGYLFELKRVILLPLYLAKSYLILITNEMIMPYTNIVQCLFGRRKCCIDFKCWVPTLHYIVFHNGLYNIITFAYNAVIHNLQSFWAVLMNYHVKLNLKCDSNNISEQQRKLYQERNCCLLQVITCNAEYVFLKIFDSHK